MITTTGFIKKARQERRTILQQAGLEKDFRKVSKMFRKEYGRNTEIFIYADTCDELGMDMFIAEVLAPLPDGLITVIGDKTVHNLITRLEEYIND